jgi:hypothetical protein
LRITLFDRVVAVAEERHLSDSKLAAYRRTWLNSSFGAAEGPALLLPARGSYITGDGLVVDGSTIVKTM